jgi:hypothetical protein
MVENEYMHTLGLGLAESNSKPQTSRGKWFVASGGPWFQTFRPPLSVSLLCF